MAKKSSTKTVETLKHDEAKRKNIPTAEFQSVLKRRNRTPCAWPMNGAIATLTHNSFGAEKMNRIGATLLFMPRRFTFRKRFTRKSSLMIFCARQRNANMETDKSLPISSPISMAFRKAWTRPSSTSTTRTGPTA